MLVIQRPSVEAIGEDHPTRQRFAVGPLEPGFGHTIGNSLRRTLLSSIPGAAITTVKFDGVEHEFTTIKGMTEDVTEFIMNLKDVVVDGGERSGGIAFGFDRLCAILGGSESIRDFIAFPKNNSGRDVMLDAPSAIDAKQFDELQIKLDLK